MKRFAHSFLLYLLFTTTSISQSNEGTNFWLGFMEHLDVYNNTKVVMVTSKYTTSGVVSIPLRDWEQPFTVAANTVQIITLPNYTEVLGSENKDNVGISVTALQPVSVYMHQYHGQRSEASVVLPISAIGKAYYVMSYSGVTRQGNVHPSEFLIVGTQDETEISITVSDFIEGGLSPGSSLNIQLDAGETYQVQARNGSDDLTGSFVSADKNFAIFGGASWTEVPTGCNARDNLLEQMYPITTWGKQFVTIPNDNMAYDLFRIMASEDNTMVEVSGLTTNTYMLNAGEFITYQRSEPTYINSSSPIMVAQYITGVFCSGHSVGDPSMVLLNSVEQTRDTVTLYNSSFENISQNYINIIMAAADVPFVTFDGQEVESLTTIQTVGLNDEFAYAQLQVSSGAHTIISQGCGVIATAYGYGNLESYAYNGGASFREINANPIPEGGCLNDTIFFDTGLPENRYSFWWDLGDGTTTTKGKFTHFYGALGSYPVELIVVDECLGTTDTLNRDLMVTLRQAVDALGDTLVCEGESFLLGATDLPGAYYEWTGPGGYFSEQQFPVVHAAKPAQSGSYSVIGIISGCATFPEFMQIEVKPTPQPDLGPDTIYCDREEVFRLSPGNYDQYLWQDNATTSTYEVSEDSNTYWVQVTDPFGCIGTDSVTLYKLCPTKIYIPNAFSPNFDGINDEFGVLGEGIISMHFQIFSRWGELVYETTDTDAYWDGQFKGKPVRAGVYVWQLALEGLLEDGSIYTDVLSGSVTLVR